ncbi:hypothetical protein EHQ12_14640 [Leptospira gomenensis]|uniref:Uncharacterized protein n=1 Tax=Leptospira gomenensis TaxID=2484974 RepID=A0A5F1YSQ0_9LEPT|nr:hypothetical protein [Leptospira gomenensis]TGK31726.1 hypothetical protein EHQ17_13165 [Leptospira gomenensis]TGK36105.1 hypothetical protein EHQ12_14640 [Leptospira gomenensis]TGK41645.1 hypothetical protein EHQ07_16305 [Leptospira gomenensis]TGK61395.1 hypothetical protein EHQ13_08560 [Leptospira gomenensis]
MKRKFGFVSPYLTLWIFTFMDVGIVFGKILPYLGNPFFSSIPARFSLILYRGKKWSQEELTSFVFPMTLITFSFAIFFTFIPEEKPVFITPADTFIVAVPSVFCFLIPFLISFEIGNIMNLEYLI